MGPGAGLGSVGRDSDRSQDLGSRWPERNLNLIPGWNRVLPLWFRLELPSPAGIPEFGYEF